MSKLEIIDNVLHQQFKSSNQQFLSEENRDTKGKKFVTKYPIIAGNLDYILYRLNPEKIDLFPFFRDVSGLKKICDYILFVEDGKYLHIFLIELKLSPNSAKKQLLASKDFAEYIIKSTRRIGYELEDSIFIKMVRICDSKIRKRKTKEEKAIEFDKDLYCDYQYPNFRLKHLI